VEGRRIKNGRFFVFRRGKKIGELRGGRDSRKFRRNFLAVFSEDAEELFARCLGVCSSEEGVRRAWCVYI